MLEESQSERKAALVKMQGTLEALREEMGEAHARSSMQRALTARAHEEDAIRATVRESRASLRYNTGQNLECVEVWKIALFFWTFLGLYLRYSLFKMSHSVQISFAACFGV